MTLRISLAGALICGVALILGSAAPSRADSDDKDPVLAAVGDIACLPAGDVNLAEDNLSPPESVTPGNECSTGRWQAQTATAGQIEAMQPDLVALLGDQQYQAGHWEDYMDSFDHTYGAFKWLHRPSPGNHEYYTSKGEAGVQGVGYFDYYNGYETDPMTGAPITKVINTHDAGSENITQPIPLQNGQAGPYGTTGDGWYSYNVGRWHLISLNIECAVEPGSCDTNPKTNPDGWLTRETAWLAQDLAQNTAPCTLAYWHQPTFSAAGALSMEGTAADVWWKLLYQHHADIVLNGHDHLYARYFPMDPNGHRNSQGLREFIVGTGGESLDTLQPIAADPNRVTGADGFYGVMKLTLHPGGYSWDFEPILNSSFEPASAANFSDTGSAACHLAQNSDGNENSQGNQN